MANKVVFVNEARHTKVVEVTTMFENGSHVVNLLKSFPNDKKVLEWGDFLYLIKIVSDPIKLFDDFIQIVELKQTGHYYIIETSDNNGKNWEFLERSKSFICYDDCYNDMKKEASEYLTNEIDIKQDFDFSEENTHSMIITFGHDYIIYEYNGSLKRFTMCGDW